MSQTEEPQDSILTVELCKRVAAHVHADTIPEAIRPGLTDLEAVLNSSDCFVEYIVYRFCSQEIPIMRNAKKNPIPTTTPKFSSVLAMNKIADELPYPAPTGSGGAVELAIVSDSKM